MTSARYLVVVAGAEPATTDALATALRDDGTVRTAYSTDALLESLDAEVDVVVVDSDLPDGPLGPLLAAVREHDHDCQVGVLAEHAAVPEARSDDVDAVVRRDESAVRESVEWLATRARYRQRLDEYYELAEERATLSDESDGEERKRLDRVERQLDALRRDLAAGFRRLDDESVFDAALSPRDRSLESDDADDADSDDADDAGSEDAGSEDDDR
ncbi:hypothetical protein [Halosimplex salinum]|uniref:hypothetical protein n=1 Tax=Halosimplex salinum TaxID=1710538 RepID=UPI000F48D2D1|nr:hypothetical protein [Halosimplex salinum]